MYINVEKIFVDYDSRKLVLVDSRNPIFSWSVQSDGDGGYQNSYFVAVNDINGTVWESGEIHTKNQSTVYDGVPLKPGENYTVTVTITDNRGVKSQPKSAHFCYLDKRKWVAKHIGAKEVSDDTAQYFYRGFRLEEKPLRAILYASGIGYQYVTVNGEDIEKSFLNPAVSAYDKRCYYTATNVTEALHMGENRICAVVGNGWRYVNGFFGKLPRNERGVPDFFGKSCFIAELELVYADRVEIIPTDESWLAGYGAVTYNHLFHGETYDAGAALPYWDTDEYMGEGLLSAVPFDGKDLGRLVPQTLPPVTEQRRLYAQNIYRKGEDSYILDFGENVAGIGCLRIPEDVKAGTKIVIEYDEELFEGDLGKETLRKVRATDTYIAGEKNLSEWIPKFCYHGFRYAKISGLGKRPDIDTLTAIVFCNDIKSTSFFKCGSALVTQLHENIVRTEMSNLHHLATDCPQRGERLGWMNDATVRFEEMPYNFNANRLFRKISDDILDEQDKESGAITCTAPYVWGGRPADPVCSSYLVMGLENLLHYGDTSTIEKHYESYKQWNECIASLKNSEGIVEYSKYGDWASPEDFCVGGFDGVRSAVTDPYLMSTGYHYYNYVLLAHFAELLGKKEEQTYHTHCAEKVREAFLKKWFKRESGCVDSGSQGAQAFALWLGILPKECEQMAAKRMFEAVERVGYRLSTGNLTTKYLLDMLAKFGYEDAAWKLLCREEYPSWGYMIQHGATTVWERFEQKRGSNMNSHNHPMYGAVDYWLYAYLLGIKPSENGFERFEIAPVFPKSLHYAEGRVETVYGNIYVCWRKEFEHLYITVDIPFGTSATLKLFGENRELTSGVHHISFEE